MLKTKVRHTPLCLCVCARRRTCKLSCSYVQLLATLWTIAHWAPLSIEFSRQYWSRLPFPTPGDPPDPRIEPPSPVSCIGRWILHHWATREAAHIPTVHLFCGFLFLKKSLGDEEPRWRRTRTGRPLSLLQIHRKNNWSQSKLHRTTSDRQQRTSNTQKSSPLSSKGGRTKYKR